MKRKPKQSGSTAGGRKPIFPIRLAPEEKALIRRAAGDLPAGTWARVTLLKAARKELAARKEE